MPTLSLLTAFAREVIASRKVERVPEPDLVMGDAAQVEAYAEAGRIDGAMAAVYLFHTARITQVISGCKTVLDLCCGPATQLAHVARFNPETKFLGIDLSATMLADARQHVVQEQITNVDFLEADVTHLATIPDHSVDAVMSTMALHHLPTIEHLDACFGEIRRVLRPGGAVYLTDFSRLKTEKSLRYFANRNAKHEPALFTADYERSLRAAFLKDEFARLTRTHFAGHVKLESTFKMPLFVIAKTADRPLTTELLAQFSTLRKALPPRYRKDLDDLRVFFTLGGLRNDPF